MSLSLRPYQAEGIDFLAEHRRAALFDEPGLGKSMQALLAMDDLVPSGRLLVVAPGDATGVWQDEAVRWLGVEASVFSGPGADPSVLEDGLVITNYHRLSTALEHGGWDGVIFDESQILRNRNTRTLFKTAKHYFATTLSKVPLFFLSGTPVVKAAGDLWPILFAIDRKRWKSYWAFVNKYAVTWQDEYGWHVEGVTNVRGLWDEIGSVSLRRRKSQVQPDLPPKIRQAIPLAMTPMQSKAYHQMAKEMWAEVDEAPARLGGGELVLTSSVLGRETRLRQLLACPRILGIDDDGASLNALAEIADRDSRPLVIFTPFAEAISYVEWKLGARPVYRVQGGMRPGALAESVRLFKMAAKGGRAPVLVSTVSMGKSWSVSEVASDCYMLQFDWNATTMLQAEDRLHRDGQKDTVYAGYFTHIGTHDVDALDVLGGKKRLADVIVDRRTRHR